MRSTWPDSRFVFHRRARAPESTNRESSSATPPSLRAHLAQRFSSLAVSPRLSAYLALLAAVLVAPSLFVGFQLDDYAHRFCSLRSTGAEAICPTSLSLFTVATGRPEVMHRAIENGLAPFWAYGGLVIDFLRPLSAFTHFVDYHLFPGSPAVMHAENIAWFAGSIFFATLFYRSMMGVGLVSAAAAFAFAVDHVHGLPAGWIANRNAVMGAFFGTVALVAYERTTRRPSLRTTAVATTSLVLGLLSGEIALGAWAYLLAHALVLDRRSFRERALALAPYAMATLAWRAVYSATGHGAVGSSLYVDPVREPLAFLSVLPSRLPLLLQGVFGFPPAESSFFATPALERVGLLGAVAFSVALVVAFGKLAWRDRSARFWAVGMSLSLLSVCSAVPHNRLLYFPSLGGIGLLAVTIDAFTRNDARLPTGMARGVSQLVVKLSGGLHAFVSPLLLPLAACTVWLTHTVADRAIPSALATMTDVAHQDLILVSAPENYVAEYLRLVRRAEQKSEPDRLRLLSVGSVAMRARRIDAHQLELTYDHGLVESMPLRLYRNAAHPMAAGDTIRLEGLTIVVTRVTRDGRPATATFTFAEPLDSPRLRWAIWQSDHFVAFVPPANDGDVVDIAPARSEFTLG
jgi:hypothetical protein